jgi:hypothetical protein
MNRLWIASRVPIWGLTFIAQSSQAVLVVYDNMLSTIERDTLLARPDVRDVVFESQANPDAPLPRSNPLGREGPEDDQAPAFM